MTRYEKQKGRSFPELGQMPIILKLSMALFIFLPFLWSVYPHNLFITEIVYHFRRPPVTQGTSKNLLIQFQPLTFKGVVIIKPPVGVNDCYPLIIECLIHITRSYKKICTVVQEITYRNKLI